MNKLFFIMARSRTKPTNLQLIFFGSWVSNLVQTFDIGPDRTRVGIVVYSDEPKLPIAMNDYTNKEDLVAAVQKLEYLEGRRWSDNNVIEVFIVA